jgi:hypothetical protein
MVGEEETQMINDGGPAYPGKRLEYEQSGGSHNYVEIQYPGMSLRDWFAGMALSVTSSATGAYQLADAMLAERAKEPPV